MDIEIKLEKLSGHSKEGKVGKIHIKQGDNIKPNDIICEVESNKGNMQVESNASGIVKSIGIEEGATIKIGDIVAIIDGEIQSVQAKQQVTSSNATSFNYFAGLIKPRKEEIECDITIVGGGPGGYVAAIQAAKLGAKVTLVEKDSLGGTCLNWGCIPTKSIVRSSEVFRNLREAEEYGLHAENISVDMKKVIMRKNNVVKQLVQGVEYLLDKNGVKLVKGEGTIIDNETVIVKGSMSEATVKTKNIVIATGSKSASVPIPGFDSKNVLSSREILDLEKLPEKLVVVGGGVIGMEMAFVFANFGVEVTVIEYLDTVLAMLDSDVTEEVSAIAKSRGIKLYTGSKVDSIMESEDGGCIVSFTQDGKTRYSTSDKVLMCIGRMPYLEGIDTEKLGLELNENKKGIKVNSKMQTNIPNIFAIGDVTNIIQLAHVASHQGIVAVKNIMGQNRHMEYDVVPSAIFTDPEIATVGTGEDAAKKNNIDIEVGKFPFAANGKALTMGEGRGFVKIVKEKTSGKIIGGTIIGPHATDLISEITLAIRNGLTAEQVIETIHAHPTTAESIHEAALSVEGGALHFA